MCKDHVLGEELVIDVSADGMNGGTQRLSELSMERKGCSGCESRTDTGKPMKSVSAGIDVRSLVRVESKKNNGRGEGLFKF